MYEIPIKQIETDSVIVTLYKRKNTYIKEVLKRITGLMLTEQVHKTKKSALADVDAYLKEKGAKITLK